MMTKEMQNEATGLYQRHRPKTLDDLLGQPEVVKTVEAWFAKGKVPRAILLTGGSGCGKTSLARIIKNKLGCAKNDFQQINCAVVEKPMEAVHEINATMGMAPLSGKCRVWLLDEVQSLSRAQFAQQALLSILEDTPKHCYFMLATTDASKIIPTIRTRCTAINLKPLDQKTLCKLCTSVVEKEMDVKEYPPDEVIERIAEAAEGSARKALVLLHQVMHLPTVKEQLDAIQSSDAKAAGINVARALLNQRTTWPDMAKILREVEEDPETIRRIVLSYAATVLCGGKHNERALNMLSAFERNFYDSGRGGLVLACAIVLK